MGNEIIEVDKFEEYNSLTDDEREAVLEHLRRGGSPFTTHQVTGIPKEQLMYEFGKNVDFAKACSQARAKALAKLEYSIYDLANEGPPREAVKAIELLLKANIPEYYNTGSKIEEQMKRLLKNANGN